MSAFFSRLRSFDADIDFRKGWRVAAVVSTVFVVLSLAFLGMRGLNFGIDFRGGVSWQFPAKGVSTSEITSTLNSVGQNNAQVQTLGQNDIRVEVPPVSRAEENKIADALARRTRQSVATINQNLNEVGPSWGHDVTQKAIQALIIFLAVVFLGITIFLEWRFALGAIIAVVHDLIVAVGVYAIFQFQVTPGTVIAFLTILGYSLYDTVVIFDKIRENRRLVASNSNLTYSDMVNLSLNETFMRSINTTVAAVLPVGSILVIGAWVMGAVTLEEFGLALMVGLISGAYSSVFVAAPIATWLKEREPANQALRRRVLALRAEGRLPTTPVPAAAAVDAGDGTRRPPRPAGRKAATSPAAQPARGDVTPAAEADTSGAGVGTEAEANGDADREGSEAATVGSGRGPSIPARPGSGRYSAAHPPRPRKKTPDKRRKR